MGGLSDAHIEALGIAVLAVGGWPPDRVRAALPTFRSLGLLSPDAVARMDLGVLTVALAQNGYNRGLLTSMYAERFQAVMTAIASGSLDGLPGLVEAGSKKEFEARLKEINGVGPKVASRAWDLFQ